MTKFRRINFVGLALPIDILVTVLSFFFAHLVISDRNVIEDIFSGDFISRTVTLREVVVFSLTVLAWCFIYLRFALYRSRRLSSLAVLVTDVAKVQSVIVIVVLIASLLNNRGKVEGIFLFAFWGISSLSLIVVRLMAKYILKQARLRGRNLRFMLIVGINPRAARFVRKIDSRPDLGYRILGFSDTEDRTRLGIDMGSHPFATTLDALPDFLRTRVVDEVVICLPFQAFYQEASAIISLCEKQGILVRYLLSDIFGVKMASMRTDSFDGESLVSMHTGNKKEMHTFAKHLIDFTSSLFLILLLSPVMIAAAVATRLSSPGPVFFVQKRLGFNKRIFRVYKFRTMIDGAEKLQDALEDRNEVDGAAFKIRNDPRITRVGRFLRKTSIDELPQLFNVLKGDMSLVGPRPLPIRDYNGFSEDWHRRRFSVRPGITCLWQISGRSDISFDRWMELDIEYIDRWSLSLDLKILAKTIPAVIKGSGAV